MTYNLPLKSISLVYTTEHSAKCRVPWESKAFKEENKTWKSINACQCAET